MATYEEIYGKRVDVLSSDPTLTSANEGQVWYNSTSGTLKTVNANIEAWSSASALNTAIYYNCGAGDQTAALSFQGTAGPNPTTATQTEEYNGSGWSIGGALPASRRSGIGAGTQTAALSAGGGSAPGTAQTSTDEYNGTAWTSANALSTGRRYTAGCGTQTAAICTGGQNPSGTQIDSTEVYDGTNWTAGGAWPKTIRMEVLLGTQTATLGAGGYSTTTEVEAYEYDGSSWTATGDLNVARYVFQGFGTQTVGIVCGGEPQPAAANKTESYDGSTFSSSPANLGNPTAQAASGVASPGTAGIIFGDASGGTTGQTEEYNKSINTITAAAWASGTALGTARYGQGQFGPQTAAVAAAGSTAPATANVESYDGSSWTEGPNVNTARGLLAAAGNGTQTAGLIFGGTTSISPHNPGITNASEEYDGSSWTSGNNMNYSSRNLGGLGVQTSAVSAGGVPVLATTGEYDGTNWTAGTSLPAGLQDNQGMTGDSQTAAFVVAGEGPPGSRTTDTLEYDGTNWTAGGSINTGVMQNGASGTLTAGLTFGGSTPSGGVTTTLGYDGTSWSTRPSMATARQYAHGAGTNVATFVAGGLGPPGGAITSTEDFTGETTTLNVKTLTQS